MNHLEDVLSFHDLVQLIDYLELHIRDLQVIIGSGDYDLSVINDFLSCLKLKDHLVSIRSQFYTRPVEV